MSCTSISNSHDFATFTVPAGALGIPTVFTDEYKRSKSLQTVNPETGEVSFFDRKTQKELFDGEAERMQRWLMLRQAQQILSYGSDAFELRDKHDMLPYSPFNVDLGRDFVGPVKVKHSRVPRVVELSEGSHEVLQHLQPKFRTVLCLQRHTPGRDASVWQSKATTNCSWHDLTVCGSPWTCPLCSERIDFGRQDQIKRVYEAFQSAEVGGSTYMLTFTCRHGLGDECKLLVDSMKKAMQMLQKTMAFKEVTRRVPLKKSRDGSMPFLDYVGRIAALEATYGANGWHPHEHHLWFFKRKLTADEIFQLRSRLFAAWADCCVKCGMQAPSEQHGLDVRVALSAAEYMAKFSNLGQERRWGPEKEIASSHSKKGNKKGRSVMQILSDSMQTDNYLTWESKGDHTFRMNADCFLFLDFATAFLGKHQLQISRTLKKWLRDMGVDLDETEAGDQELASSLEEESEMQFEVDAGDFLAVVRNKAQGSVLLICKKQGSDAALEFIKSLPGRVDQSGMFQKPKEYIRDQDMGGVHSKDGQMMGLMAAKKPIRDNDAHDLWDTKFSDDMLQGRDLKLWKLKGAAAIFKSAS